MKFGEMLHQKQLYSLLKTEKSRRVTKSRPVCVGLSLYWEDLGLNTCNVV